MAKTPYVTIELTTALEAEPVTIFVDKICNLQPSEMPGQTLLMFPGGGLVAVRESQGEILSAIEEAYLETAAQPASYGKDPLNDF